MKTLATCLIILIVLVSCNSSDVSCKDLQVENTFLRDQLDSVKQKNDELAKLVLTSKAPKHNRKNQSLLKSQGTYQPSYSRTNDHSGQCAAITKKGTRCSRSAKYGNYCWQHDRQ